MRQGTHVVLNGELLPRAAARLPVDDRGFLLGDGVFETMRLYDGVPFLLDAHLRRLAASCRAVALDLPWTLEEIAAWVADLADRNGLRHGAGRLRLTMSRGSAAPGEPATPTVLVSADPYTPPEPAVYASGVAVETSSHRRHAEPWHQVKSTSRMPHLLLRREASQSAVFEVLQWNDAGYLTEGSTTNVFVVDADGVLRTPQPEDGCLRGVTRDVVLDLAAPADVRTQLGRVTDDHVARAQEIFLTGSLVEIVPVRRLDGRNVGRTCPGPITRRLHELYRDRVRTKTGP